MRTTGGRRLALVLGTAILSATACGSPDARPGAALTVPPSLGGARSAAERPIGSPTTLPWWSDGRLHVAGRTIRTPLHEIISRGGSTLVGRTDEHGSIWRLVRGTRLLTVVSTREPYVDPALSANGRHLAWVGSRTLRRFNRYASEALYTAHAYDVARRRQVATTSLRSRVTCCDQSGVIHVAGVDDDGAVLLTRDHGLIWHWRPGTAPVRVAGALRPHAVTGTDQWPGGVSWSSTGDSSGPAAFARVDDAGVATVVGRVPQGLGGIWAPHGAAYVYQPFTKAPGGPAPVVWWQDRRVRLRAHGVTALVGWESARSVILRTGHRSTVLLRCDARSGGCEQAGPALHDAVLPASAGTS